MTAPTATMASEWAEYASLALPDDAPLRQRAELKLAFYSGAFVALSIMADAIRGDDATGDLGAMARRTAVLVDEVQNFIKTSALAGLRGDELAP